MTREHFANLVSLCAPVDGGSSSGILVGVWPCSTSLSKLCDIACCRLERETYLAYLAKGDVVIVSLCREHASEMAAPRNGLMETFVKILGDKNVDLLKRAGLRPSTSERLHELGLTNRVGFLTQFGRDVYQHLESAERTAACK